MLFPSRASLLYLRFSIFILLLYFWYFCYLRTVLPNNILATKERSCSNFPSTHNVVVPIKTGATEATERVPALMQTSLRCVENIYFFSDLEQDIGEYHIHDALDSISSALMSNNADFEFYRQQKALWHEQRDISSLRGAKNPKSPDVLAAWTLDKYKFIYTLEKTWAMKPHMDWYILVDADTYVLWPNMMLWLDELNPRKKSYFGSQVNMDGIGFAHSGSGIILSGALMHGVAVTRKGVSSEWDSQTSERCCWDVALAEMLLESGTGVQDVWPSSIPFGPGSTEYWC
jgi:hypothetical protein